ncbi:MULTISPECIES: flagellar basal body rod protein FlgB [unclassified Exiguobacterium]|uniref:flagellar basal body rod protein FlgB n=2 Tax=Exiguobacterium TaxID=33986 RepID=UPI0020375A06|nr:MULTISPECIES: flagellar basal body rod protein FlgB [unclassified Exiguobacterium]
MMNWLGSDYATMTQAVDRTVAAQKVISANIANVDTPGYKSKRVVFGDVLDSEMKMSLKRHATIGTSGSIVEQSSAMRNDGNGVDIDLEMSELSRNQIEYEALVEQLNRKFSGIQSVIRGGR